MRQIGLCVIVASLAGCGQQETSASKETDPNKQHDPASESISQTAETVTNGSLGTRYCLNDSGGNTREQIRGLASNKWEAAESEDGSGKLETCDIGPILVHSPSKDCPEPPKPILRNGDRIKIVPTGTSGGGEPEFRVSVINPANDTICGKHAPLSFPAHLVADQFANGKFKWLASNADVACDDANYKIYLYFVDTPGSARTDIEKHYRIEFFNADVAECVKNAENVSRTSAEADCDSQRSAFVQEPVGDGRQHRAINATCEYLPTLAGE